MFATPSAEVAVIVGLSIIVAVMIEAVPLIYILAYPLRFFITVIHELGHGVATILTGGQFSHFVLRVDTSGTAWSRGGCRFVIIPAGYLGTTFVGMLLILFTGINEAAPFVLGGMGLLITFLVLLFGWTSATTMLGGLASGLGATLIAWYGGENWSIFFISLLAIFGSLEAVSDLRRMALIAQLGLPSRDDAVVMEETYGCSAPVWAWSWTIISLLMIGWAMWFVWFREP